MEEKAQKKKIYKKFKRIHKSGEKRRAEKKNWESRKNMKIRRIYRISEREIKKKGAEKI